MGTHSFEELEGILAPCGQNHLLRFWNQLSPEQRNQLGDQICSIDWKQVVQWSKTALSDAGSTAIPFDRLTPAKYVPLQPETTADATRLQEARAAGEALLRAGKVACFTVAGGQGTRLGYDAPKGTYCFSPLRNKSLFQYFAEAILRNQEKYATTLPWYIMTSPANHADTIRFFEQNQYFGLLPQNVRFFIQGTLPGFGLDGKALLAAPDSLALFANGHGGTFAALKDSGTLDDLEARGIDYLAYWQVDNPMVTVCDPLFIGLHHLTGSEMSSRCLIKRDAMEKLGHFTLLDGKLMIVEYSDMPKELLEQRDPDGRLTFRPGSPAIHILSRQFIRRLTDGVFALTPHRANKKISFVDEQGTLVQPTAPNGVKLEFFIFDALPLAHNPLILEADRAEEFSAIKNAEGNDSPESCRAALLERTAKWLEQAGVKIPRKADGTPDVTIEISLRRAVCAEDIAELVQKGAIPRSFAPGDQFALD
ncbi:MAG: UDPGP type 1 family protein [Victivallales bacterium]|nr:UDPGP type 1 family protein [Victivallales bacterium]